jgi:signal transduction histidine kinase
MKGRVGKSGSLHTLIVPLALFSGEKRLDGVRRAKDGLLFQNLIGNAIKYRREGETPRIHVSARRDDHGEWRFSVRDNGLGIEAQFLDAIFAPFKRLHGTEYSGTGIGLTISQRIVERYGGRIWVESTSGEGSVFYFTLPARKDVA